MARNNVAQIESRLVNFWLPIILAVIAITGTIIQVVAPQAFAMFVPKPAETVLPDPITPIGSESDVGCQTFDSKQICWGRSELLGRVDHVREFDFSFAQAFAGSPVIATTIDVKSPGYGFVVYDSKIGEGSYQGKLFEVESRHTDSLVVMSYIAIGRPQVR